MADKLSLQVKSKHKLVFFALMAGTAFAGTVPALGQDQAAPRDEANSQNARADPLDQLRIGFESPPREARPLAWWHWLNGNISQEGIVLDLEWMHRVGIGGAQFFDAGAILSPPKVVDNRVIVGDERWRAAVQTAAATADRLGLDLSIAASPGWSITGGPWVKPAEAMKKYVWSETLVRGGRAAGRLPQPPQTTGMFQDAEKPGSLGARPDQPKFYADAMVVAYKLPPVERKNVRPLRLSSSSGDLDLALLNDGAVGPKVTVTGEPDAKAAWVQASFRRPTTVRGISLGIIGRAASEGDEKPQVEISKDGRSWQVGTILTGPADAPLKTYSFAPLTARYFRLSLPPEPPAPAYLSAFAPGPRKGPVEIALSELVFHTAAPVNRFAEKAGFGEPISYADVPTMPSDATAEIAAEDVVDLTGRMSSDGTLDWTAPKGDWRVIRLGYTLTGQQNAPAPTEATGLEVDKFSPKHVRSYLDQYLGRFEAATGPDLIGRKGIRNLLTDSWEAGTQNWTDDMRAEFKARRGYDLASWLPVLTGRVVGSASESDRFLWDYRRTLQDLLVQHYDTLASELHKRGMGLYSEAQGDNWRAIGDGLEIKSRADVPMAEYWYETFAAGPGQPSLKTDMKEAASAAHIYGKPIAANESLAVGSSTPWGYAPAKLKPVIDEIFAYGINRIVLHTVAHQPIIGKKPGIALGPIGQYLNRNETWAEQAKPFFDYIARASYLLQQGQYVADVAYFYGEERPLVAQFKGKYDEARDRYIIDVPSGYGYDFVNAETLTKATSVDAGRLLTSGGMRYRILYLGPETKAMTLATLKRLEALVTAGVVLVGNRPERVLGLADDADHFRKAADRLWGTGDKRVRSVGAGKVYATAALAEALAAEQISPDVEFVGAADPNILQLHRRTRDGGDVYFLVNREKTPQIVEARFNVAGKRPELWHADTGKTEPLSFRTENGFTIVPLNLAARDSAFIVMRRPSNAQTLTVAEPVMMPLSTLDGPWTVRFAPDLGAPAKVTFPILTSWSDNSDAGVRFFSGTAVYEKTLDVPASLLAHGRQIQIDLGTVHELAEVVLNGKVIGNLWKPPYRLDLTKALRPGRNRLEIRVTNLWPNRIIGDLQPGVTTKYTWTPYSPLFGSFQWKADSNLLPSGLLGPVTLQATELAR